MYLTVAKIRLKLNNRCLGVDTTSGERKIGLVEGMREREWPLREWG